MIQDSSIPTHPPQNLRQIRLLLLSRQCASTATVSLLLRILLLGFLLLLRPCAIPAGLLLLLRVTLVERRVDIGAWRNSTRWRRLLVCLLLLLLLIMVASVSGLLGTLCLSLWTRRRCRIAVLEGIAAELIVLRLRRLLLVRSLWIRAVRL